jgi:signal transduction histidine kinase
MQAISLRHWYQHVTANIVVFAAYILLAVPTYFISQHYHIQSPLWPQSGLALAALILLGRSVWPSVFAGSMVSHSTVYVFLYHAQLAKSLLLAATVGLSSTIEALIGLFILNRLMSGEPLFFSLQSIKRYLLAVLLMSMFGSLLGTTFHLLFKTITPGDFLISWIIWWFADFIGIMLFATLIISFKPEYCEKWNAGRFIQFMLLFVSAVVFEIVFNMVFDKKNLMVFAPFLTLPFLLWITYRFTLRTVVSTLLAVTIVSVWITLVQHAITSGQDMRIYLLEIQIFGGVSILSFLILHAAIYRMRMANAEMIKTHNELELIVFERTKELQVRLAEMIKSEEALLKSQKQLRELNATKDKFFSIIAHDLRNPFNALLGFGELLVNNLRFIKTEEVEGMLQSMNKSIRGVFNLLENLLSWSRIQTHTIKYNPQVFDLSVLTDENAELLERFSKEKNIILKNEIPDYTLAYADPNMISTVFRNLMMNAVKYSYPGGIIVITVNDSNNDLWEVSVKDEGIGMAKEIKDQIFGNDVIESLPGTMEEKGTGLGMKICKEFVEQNCGKIWVDSEPGLGSVFKFTVPKKREKKV